MRKIFLLLFFFGHIVFAADDVGERAHSVRKIVKLYLEEALRQRILKHAYELPATEKYPVETRALKDLPECADLLYALELHAGPVKLWKLNNEFNEAVRDVNSEDPYMGLYMGLALVGVCAVTVVGLGAFLAAPFFVPGTVVAAKSTAVLGACKTVAVATGATLSANSGISLSVVLCVSNMMVNKAIENSLKDLSEDDLRKEVKKLKKCKESHGSLKDEVRRIRDDKVFGGK